MLCDSAWMLRTSAVRAYLKWRTHDDVAFIAYESVMYDTVKVLYGASVACVV